MADLKKQAEDLQAKVVQLQREAELQPWNSGRTGKEIAYSATLDRLQQSTEALAQSTSNRILKGEFMRWPRAAIPR